ncbi:DNA/RNA non-specific endonuclease [Streptococcus sp. 27098_8_113]|uniref:DNA/RNA non-specific endonuclease n=1 Tax=Streptococcus sp. 27098_8_113 TaxID=3003669 RepID=UPI00352ECF1D
MGEYNYFTNRDGYCIKYKRVIWLALIFHLLSQAKDVNLKEHRRLEREWMNALKDNKKVSVTVKIKYDSNSLRLSKFQVRYKIDRKTRIEIIRNIYKR